MIVSRCLKSPYGYPDFIWCAMSEIAAVVTDLIFATRISSEARAIGCTVRMIRKLEVLDELLTHAPPKLLIVDLNAVGIDPLAAIALARNCDKPPRICAYLSHVQHELAQQARNLGTDQVLPRSRFVDELPSLLAEYKNGNS
jgi:CheY-like chemotaxis protein